MERKQVRPTCGKQLKMRDVCAPMYIIFSPFIPSFVGIFYGHLINIFQVIENCEY